jgi:methyl-accepting chemotaxis protein
LSRWLVSLAAVAVLIELCLLIRTVDRVVGSLPGEIGGTRAVLVAQIAVTRADLLAEIDKQASAIRKDATAQVSALRTDTLALLDKRTGELLTMADSRATEATGALARLEQDVVPIAADTDATVALLRPQALGLLAAAKVTVGETAQTMRTVRDAAPELTRSAQRVGDSAAGIAADVQREADSIVRPKHWWEKILGPVYIVARIAGAFL